MDLTKYLNQTGYTSAKEELESVKKLRATLADALPGSTDVTGILADIAQLDASIKEAEKSLAADYDSAVKFVDAKNDLELINEDLGEHAELVAEEFDKIDPKAAEWIRILMSGQDPGPPPKPSRKPTNK